MRKFLVGMISVMMFVTSGVCLYAEGETEETNENSESPAQTPAAGLSLQDKIDFAINNTYTLMDYDFGSIVIKKDQVLTLDLNGHTLTNDNGRHTIENHGTLTIIDSKGNGTVDNISHGRGAIYNYPEGTVTLNGGTYTRSKEAGSDADTNGGNSWYTIKNYGTMTINDGVTVNQGAEGNGKYSSLIVNGWYDISKSPANNEPEPINGQTAKLTINGGNLSGGLWVVKNDDNGETTINGGTIKGYASGGTVYNVNLLTINNGNLISLSDNLGVVCTTAVDDKFDKGITNITGGTFSGSKECITGLNKYGKDPQIGISGGTFSNDVSKYLASGNNCTFINGKYEIIKDGDSLAVDTITPAVDETVLNNIKQIDDKDPTETVNALQAIVKAPITPTDDEKAAIDKVVKNLIADDSKTIEYEYFDLSLYVMKDGELTPNKITELTTEAVITLYLDDATLAKIKDNDFKLSRMHNGDAEILNAELNGNALTFKTSKFSTYSLAIIKNNVTPTEATTETKQNSGWDDGGPFTTDNCGNVFDRWGNKIYEANGCSTGGYNLVRTGVE